MVALVKVPAGLMEGEEELRTLSNRSIRLACRGVVSSKGEENFSLLISSGSFLMLPEPKMTLPALALYSKAFMVQKNELE